MQFNRWLFLALFTFVGCSDSHTSKSNKEISPPRPDPIEFSGGNGCEEKQLELEYFSVIREFGESDRGALFGLLSDKEVEIVKVVAPRFLGGYYAGYLNDKTVENIFKKSEHPLSRERKDDLLNKFEGAHLVYFKNYENQLCTGEEYKVTIHSKVSRAEVISVINFVAYPNSLMDCEFYIFGVVTKSCSNVS